MLSGQVTVLRHWDDGVRLRTTVPGIPDADCALRFFRGSGSNSGTVMLHSGTTGAEYISSSPEGLEFVANLIVRGYTVVDRKWLGGWFAAGYSIREAAQRGALVADWVMTTGGTGGGLQGPFRAYGNSGGAAEVAYGLTSYGMGDRWDRVVLGGGPPMTRLQYLCASPPPAAWLQEAEAALQPYASQFTCSPMTWTDPATVVCPVISGVAPGALAEASVLHPGATTSFGCEVSMLLGSNDCTVATPQAAVFFTAISSAKTISIVPGGEHFMPATAGGRAAILAEVDR